MVDVAAVGITEEALRRNISDRIFPAVLPPLFLRYRNTNHITSALHHSSVACLHLDFGEVCSSLEVGSPDSKN